MKEYLNFFGDNGSFVFTKPNKSPIVGNPDRFAQDFFGEDGLDSKGLTDEYKSFDGNEGFMNHPGWFGDIFKKNNDEDEDTDTSTTDLIDTLNEFGNEPIDIGVDNSSDTEDEGGWLKNINWGNVGDFTKGFATGLGKKRNPLTNIPSGNINTGQQPTTTTTTTTEAGLGGSSKIIGIVLVGGVVLASVFYAIKMSRDK